MVITKPTTDFSKAEKYEHYPAGSATHKGLLNGEVFSLPSNNMSFERQLDFAVGNRLFTRNWSSAPSSAKASDGLGPLFNARSCQACHFKDGRGHLPSSEEDDVISLILKLQNDNNQPLPNYGNQLQDFAIQGVEPEGKVQIKYQASTVELADGVEVELVKPMFSIGSLMYGELPQGVRISARIAPPMIGLGLLEMIPEQQILVNEDVDDEDGDGISGRVNWVKQINSGDAAMGRFGWKASIATVREQIATAFFNDMGLSTAFFPRSAGDCTAMQHLCLENSNSKADSEIEINNTLLDSITFYAKNLAVPARRDPVSPNVLKGKQLFYEAGCVNCHKPKFITRTDSQQPELSRQLIWPYTDMLLHDMGNDLADGFAESSANGREWRTAPLWGIGLTTLVNREIGYLHDGRARNILEAIIWHGGEAQQSRDRVVQMSTKERQQLLMFIGSL